MATIAQIVLQIRQALFGKDVRENIAQGIEKCYSDVQAGVTEADTAAARANTSADRSDEINEALEDNAKDLVLIQNSQPNKEFNRIWIKPESDEYIVPTYDEFSDVKNSYENSRIYGSGNLLFPIRYVESGTLRGITYGWNRTKTAYVISGTIEEGYDSFSSTLFVKQPLPAGLEAGKTYHVKYSSVNVPLYIYSHNANRAAERIFKSKTSGDFTIPDDTEELDVRFFFATGIEFNEEIEIPVVYNDNSNIKLASDIENLEESLEESESVFKADINRNWPTLLFHKNRVPTFRYDGDDMIVSINGAIRVDNIGRMSASGTITGDYRIQSGQHLVYNTTSKELLVRSSSAEFLEDDIELLFLTNNSAALGQWAPYYYIQRAREYAEDLNTNTRNDLTPMFVPDYYNTDDYLSNRITSINTIAESLPKQSGRMVFVTDYHHGTNKNANKSPCLINKIISEAGIRNVVFGGDAYDKENSPSKAQVRFFEFLDMFRPLEDRANVFYITGNHEYNNPSSDPAWNENMLTMRTVYEMYMGHTPPKVVRIEDTNAFYYDDDVAKMRMYFVDCDYSSLITMDLRKNMLQTLFTVPDGYAVMIFSHTGITSGPVVSNRMQQICAVCEAMNDGTSVTINYTSSDSVTYDFTGKARTFIGVLSGHVHSDGYVYYNNRFPVISTTCDAYGKQTSNPAPERQPGSIYEQAFDVVQIDVPGKLIYLTRIGWGEDRVFSFGDPGSGLITE